MRRLHLFEFNDIEACPKPFRDSVVETLGRGLRWSNLGDIIGPSFKAFAERTGSKRVLDLCSGTAEPVSILLNWLKKDAGQGRIPHFLVSDLFPNLACFRKATKLLPGDVSAVEEPVNALGVDGGIEHDTRTIINAFHHFPPELAQGILADTVKQRKSIFIYEGFTRTPYGIVPMGPFLLASLFSNPLLAGSHRLVKAFFTYLVPLIPLISLWDGLVSTMRVYNEAELLSMAEPLTNDYQWEYREVPYYMGGKALVFTGVPNERLK
ncbi:MAG: hypothetical protein VX834_11600 [Myxococcota bacterium]|nr:hypothetical protein [Myxococcota bacterium]